MCIIGFGIWCLYITNIFLYASHCCKHGWTLLLQKFLFPWMALGHFSFSTWFKHVMKLWKKMLVGSLKNKKCQEFQCLRSAKTFSFSKYTKCCVWQNACHTCTTIGLTVKWKVSVIIESVLYKCRMEGLNEALNSVFISDINTKHESNRS